MTDQKRELALAVDLAADAVPGVDRLYSAVPARVHVRVSRVALDWRA